MKVALYLRVSTTEQFLEGYSLAAQLNILRAYAVANEYTIYKVYQDQGISGKNIKDRPELLSLIEDAKDRQFDIVLVWKLSRLSRSLLDVLSIVDIFSKNNVSLISHSEHFETATPIGKMLLQLLGSIAEFERNTIIENVKLGLGERFKQGYSKGSIPFGYVSIDKKAVIDKEQAELVKFAFNHYVSTPDPRCMLYIAEKFNAAGFRTTRKNGLWTRFTIKELLLNKFYAGYVRTGVMSHGRKKDYYSETIGQHEPIISLELWQKANDKIDKHKRVDFKSQVSDCFLTGLVYCPKCKGKMYGLESYCDYTKISGENKRYYRTYYRCNNSGNGKKLCKGFTVSARKIEKEVMDMLQKALKKGTYNKLVKYSVEQKKSEITPRVSNLKFIEKKLKEAYVLREKYYKLFETGKVEVSMFADKINEILATISELEIEKLEEIKKAQVPDSKVDYNELIFMVKQLSSEFSSLSNEDKKTAIRMIINEIVIGDNKQVERIILTSGLIITRDILGM